MAAMMGYGTPLGQLGQGYAGSQAQNPSGYLSRFQGSNLFHDPNFQNLNQTGQPSSIANPQYGDTNPMAGAPAGGGGVGQTRQWMQDTGTTGTRSRRSADG